MTVGQKDSRIPYGPTVSKNLIWPVDIWIASSTQKLPLQQLILALRKTQWNTDIRRPGTKEEIEFI